MIKRLFSCLMILMVVLGLGCSCSKEPAVPQNAIAPMALSQEQAEIMSLLDTSNQSILIFEYKTKDEYNSAEFWVEVYEDGVLVDTPAKISYYSDDEYQLDGKLAIVITNNNNYQWMLSAKENDAVYSHIGESSRVSDEIFASGSSSGGFVVEIEDGKEIVLYTSMFSNGEIRTYSDQQRYVEEPELLKEYPYMHIIKCKFNKFITAGQ